MCSASRMWYATHLYLMSIHKCYMWWVYISVLHTCDTRLIYTWWVYINAIIDEYIWVYYIRATGITFWFRYETHLYVICLEPASRYSVVYKYVHIFVSVYQYVKPTMYICSYLYIRTCVFAYICTSMSLIHMWHASFCNRHLAILLCTFIHVFISIC